MAKKKDNSKPELTDVQKKQVKVDNFTRICPPRIDKAVKAIKMVGDCTNPTYSYSTVQGDSVLQALYGAVDEVKARFEGLQGKSGGFVLPE